VEMSRLSLDVNVLALAASGSTLYVLANEDNFLVVDVENPASPTVVGEYSMPGSSGRARVVDDRLYASLSHGGLAVFDLADPLSPDIIGWIDTPRDIAMGIGDGFVIVPSHRGYGYEVDFYDSQEWPAPAHYATAEIAPECSEIVIDGDRAVLSTSERPVALQVVDIADTANPFVVGTYAPTGYAGWGIGVSGEYAYLARAGDASEVISIAEPATPTPVGVIGEDDARFYDFEICEGVLFGVSLGGLVIFDLVDPETPAELSRIRPLSNTRHIAVVPGVVYLGGTGDVAVIDVSVPESPVVVAELDAQISIDRVRVAGNLLLVVGSGIAVYDIQDPLAPVFLGRNAGGWQIADTCLVGDLAYCADHAGIIVFDLSDPSTPFPLKRLTPLGGGLGAVALRDGLGYFGSSTAGEMVVVGLDPCDRCIADWNGDGMTNSIDLIAFLNVWAAERGTDCSQSGCSADIDENGLVDSRDFIAFLNAWNAGC